MSSSAAEPSPHLVCPACRRLEPTGLVAHPLQAHEAGLACPGCGEVYPVVDGIPLVLARLDAWLAEEAAALVCRADLAPAVHTRIARGAGGPLWRDIERARVQASSPDSPLHAWIRAVLDALPGDRIELGAGHGAHGVGELVAVDLHWQALRRHRGTAVLADALDPPFPPGCFDVVMAINLLDSCRDPGLLLHQAAALLRPAGTLILASPLHWQASVTSPALWLSAEAVRGWLAGQGFAIEEGVQPLFLRTGPHSVVEHRCLTWIARRPAAADAR